MWKFLLLFAACIGPIAAQCPHQTIVRQPTIIKMGPQMECGGVAIQQFGVSIKSSGCPSYALIVPPHDRTEYRPGANTFTEPAGKADVTLLQFDCMKNWFIFIPLGSSCRQVRSQVVAQLTTYQQFTCKQLEPELEPKPIGRGE